MRVSHLLSVVFIVIATLQLPASARPALCHPAQLAGKYARMLREDQALRGKYILILEQEAARKTIDQVAKERIEHTILETDADNQIALDRLIDTCGWPGNLDRRRAAVSAFYIVQHGPLPYQLRYFPIIRAANKRGEISGEHLAWLTDRVLARQGKLQKYGTEFEYGTNRILPVEDPTNVNKRRKRIGLPPLKAFPE